MFMKLFMKLNVIILKTNISKKLQVIHWIKYEIK